MFYYLNGMVAHVEPGLAVLDCGGVGYALAVSATTLSNLKVGEDAKLYTHLYVREEIFDLYGFYTVNERNCFQLLLSVSGVGPKAALSILSANTPERLAVSIITGEERALTVAPGIGKKIAQRIILELKDKLAKGQIPVGESFAPISALGDQTGEAMAALAVLGYSNEEVSMALRGIDPNALSLEELIRSALKRLDKFK